jgi:hypothetical protein
MTPPVIVGLAFRIHPRTQSTLVNAVAVEIGARMTDTLGTHAAEATVAALVMWPPVKYRRSCFGGKWH